MNGKKFPVGELIAALVVVITLSFIVSATCAEFIAPRHSLKADSEPVYITDGNVTTTRTMGTAPISWNGNATTLNVSNNAAGAQYSDSWDGSSYIAQGWRGTTNANGIQFELEHCLVTPTPYTANASCYVPDDLAALTSSLTTVGGSGSMPFEPAAAYRVKATISGTSNGAAANLTRTYQQ